MRGLFLLFVFTNTLLFSQNSTYKGYEFEWDINKNDIIICANDSNLVYSLGVKTMNEAVDYNKKNECVFFNDNFPLHEEEVSKFIKYYGCSDVPFKLPEMSKELKEFMYFINKQPSNIVVWYVHPELDENNIPIYIEFYYKDHYLLAYGSEYYEPLNKYSEPKTLLSYYKIKKALN